MTHDEHLAWCKKRAHEYVESGDLPGAITSMASDLGKHPETANHAGIDLGMMLLFNGHLRGTQEVREFIDGFR